MIIIMIITIAISMRICTTTIIVTTNMITIIVILIAILIIIIRFTLQFCHYCYYYETNMVIQTIAINAIDIDNDNGAIILIIINNVHRIRTSNNVSTIAIIIVTTR